MSYVQRIEKTIIFFTNLNAMNLQDEETMTHFGHFAKMFAFLAEYRGVLMAEAESKGWPLMRHMVRIERYSFFLFLSIIQCVIFFVIVISGSSLCV